MTQFAVPIASDRIEEARDSLLGVGISVLGPASAEWTSVPDSQVPGDRLVALLAAESATDAAARVRGIVGVDCIVDTAKPYDARA